MKAVLSTLALVFLCSASALAQQDETLVSKFRLDLSGAWGGWHPTLTEIGDQNVVMNGGFGGLEFNKTVFIGWAAYKVSDEVTIDGRDRDFDFNYTGPTVQYTPLASKVAHPKFAMLVGFGDFNIDGDEFGLEDENDRLLVLQPSLGGEVNVLRWFRLGGELGYRFIVNGDNGEGDLFAPGFFGAATLKFGFSWGG